jgi:perosamine synthetase
MRSRQYLPADPPLTLRDLSGITRPPEPGGRIGRWLPDRTRFYGSGRAALWGALRSLGIGPGDQVLLPAYLCESVVSPVLAVGAGASIFPVGRDLRPDLKALEASLGPSSRAVVIIHYLGFPGPIEEVQQICSRHGLALIEDCAHALFSRKGGRLLGSFGDAAVFSPWKSLPLPDGGMLAVNGSRALPEAPTAAPSWYGTVAKLGYRSLGAVESAIGWTPRLGLLRRSTIRRDLHRRTSGAPVEVRSGSALARRMLESAQPERVVARRRENYSRLLEVAGELDWAQPIYDKLPEGVCPLGFPLVADRRDDWRDLLLRNGVNVRTYWEELPAEVDRQRFPDAAWVSDSMLVLPVHQELRSGQIAWLAQRLRALGARKANGTLAHR